MSQIILASASPRRKELLEEDDFIIQKVADILKDEPEAQSKELNQKIANGYLMYASWFKEEEK